MVQLANKMLRCEGGCFVTETDQTEALQINDKIKIICPMRNASSQTTGMMAF